METRSSNQITHQQRAIEEKKNIQSKVAYMLLKFSQNKLKKY